MKISYRFILWILGMMLLHDEGVAQTQNAISWSVAARLPVLPGMQQPLGVAGAFTGVSNHVLIVAGGSNFEKGIMPWRGGKKVYLDDIYALKRSSANTFTWLDVKTRRLPHKIAYGASTTLADGIVCAGGEVGSGHDSRDVFMMRWDEQKNEVQFRVLPPLPVATANACMSHIGDMIYLAGGETNGQPSAFFYTLNLSNKSGQWQVLPPLPVAMSHSVMIAQSNGRYPCIYVIGGRSSTPSGISTLHHNAYCYDSQKKHWSAIADIGQGVGVTNLSAAAGVAYGRHEILLTGGDKGIIFHQLETYNALIASEKNEKTKQHLQAEKAAMLNHHPGFSRTIYAYNTVNNSWRIAGQLPFYGQVTTTAVWWDKEIFIPCGEIKPGTRTPDITRGIINTAK